MEAGDDGVDARETHSQQDRKGIGRGGCYPEVDARNIGCASDAGPSLCATCCRPSRRRARAVSSDSAAASETVPASAWNPHVVGDHGRDTGEVGRRRRRSGVDGEDYQVVVGAAPGTRACPSSTSAPKTKSKPSAVVRSAWSTSSLGGTIGA